MTSSSDGPNTISQIIDQSSIPEILKNLSKGKTEEVKRFLSRPKKKFSLFKKESKSKPDLDFFYIILSASLLKKLVPSEYKSVCIPDFTSEFRDSINALLDSILVLEKSAQLPEIRNILSSTCLAYLQDAAEYISKESNDYPHNGMNGGVWFDGVYLRSVAKELATYFSRQKEDDNEVQSLYIKAKITLSIMSHYMHLVGPDMIAIAEKFESINKPEDAKKFYRPVIQDFSEEMFELVSEYSKNSDEENEYNEETLIITESLCKALNGFKRLGEEIDESLLLKSENFLSHNKKSKRP